MAVRLTTYVWRPSALIISALSLVASSVAQDGSTSTPAANSLPPDSSSPSAVRSSTSDQASITNTGPVATTDAPTSVVIIGGPQASTADGLTGFPTLTGPGVIPTYPPASVPPTVNAPFMHQSSLPDGTVFIVVGSILGALGLALLLWRIIASLMLHRSVERAALAQMVSDKKTGFPAPPAPFYKYTDQASSMSLGGGGPGGAASTGRGTRRTNRGPIPSTTPSQSNLFFSPTAGAGAGAGAGAASVRSSTFLPSGFYAANANSPGGGGNYANSIGMSNLKPDSHGQYESISRQTMDVTPPGSPQVAARYDPSTSSLQVNLHPSQRPPSAFLDDLLTDDSNALPPPHMPPFPGTRRGSSSGNRF